MIVFVDTSAWYAVLASRDPNHATARAIFRRLASARDHLVTHNYVVVETLALVGRRLGMEAVRTFSLDLQGVSDVEWVMPAVHDRALAGYLDSSRELSFVDHVSFAVMRTRGIRTAFAFDRDFEAHGFALLRA